MRDIKFRGKRFYDKEWCFGWLLKDLENSTAYYQECPYRIIWYKGTAHCNSPVITETIGQYTGLKDANGKDIYEGDIVRHKQYVKYGELSEHTGIIKITPLDGVIVGMDSIGRDYEVIGNIHDNPELMEGMK